MKIETKRVSPFSFAGPARFHPSPVTVDELPAIDVVVISHDHYDHLDHETITALSTKTGKFIVPLGVGAHLLAWGIDSRHIIELDWWESAVVSEMSFTATPAQHFSGRGLRDRNRTLWASWAINGQQHSVYYSGDTGWFDGFREIGDRLGPFDMTLMHIGAYAKQWESVHMTPEDAVRAHADVRGGVMLPVHWGTFNLALHSWTDPVDRLLDANEGKVVIATPRPGERIGINDTASTRWWMEEPWLALLGTASAVAD